MQGSQIGGTEPVRWTGSGGGGETTGHGGAPDTSAPPTPPVAVVASPEAVRAILSGTPAPATTSAATGAPAPAPTSSPNFQSSEGLVSLKSVEQVLPSLLSRAAASGIPVTVALARPGPAATALRRAPVPPAGDVADLAAALSVSVGPDQHLLRAGPSHLAVVLPGGPAAGQRQADRLMRRAAASGAPMLTFATAHHPRDGASAATLVEIARMRLDEPADERAWGAADEAEEGRRRVGAIWGAVAAAIVVAAIILAMHGHGKNGLGGSTNAIGRSAASTASGTASGPGAGLGSSSSGSGGQSSGTGAGAGSGAASSGTGTGSNGAAGNSSSGSPNPGSSSSPSGGGGSSGGSVLSGLPGNSGSTSTGSSTGNLPVGGGGTQTSVPPVPTPSLPGATTTTTTTSVPGGGGSNQCSGLLNSLLCTVNGLLGGH